MSDLYSDDLRRHTGRYYGKYRGEVVDDVDERQQGTITVKVPSILGTETAVRARACLPYGHFFVPPIGAHIWVEFEAGSLDLPLWVGTWYPEGETPVEAQVSPPDHRVIQTVAGHTIELVDHEGEEKILIRHSSDAFVSIDPNGSILISNPKGSHIHLDADGEQATLVEQHGNYLTMSDKGTSIVNPDGTVLDIAGDTVNVSAKKVVVQSTSVALGVGATDPTIMGNAFKMLWQQVQFHTHPSAVGPTGPSPQLLPALLVDGVHLTSSVVVK